MRKQFGLLSIVLSIFLALPALAASVRVLEDGVDKGLVEELNFINAEVVRTGMQADIEAGAGSGSGFINEIFVAKNALLDAGNGTGVRKNMLTTSIDGVYQYLVYWDDEDYLETCQRTIATQQYFTCYQQTGIQQITDKDSHRQPSIGVDPDGYIHLNYHNWADALNYRRSTNPNDISTFGSETTMGGVAETQVTYMIFFNDFTNGGKLYATYRDGTSGNGDQYVKVYDHSTETWDVLPGTSSGKLTNGKATTDSAYLYGPPKFDDNGDFHLAATWWDSNISTVDAHDVWYVKWDQSSQTFVKSTGATQTVPITQANWDRAVIVPKGSGGIASNGDGLDIDANGNPYIVYTKNDSVGNRQAYVVYSDGTTWTDKQITFGDKKTISFITQVFADRAEGKFYVVQTSDTEGGQDTVIETSDGFQSTETYKISNKPGPRYPQYDYNRWELHKILDMAVFYQLPYDSTVTIREWSPGYKSASLFRNDTEDFTIAKDVIMRNPAPQFKEATTYNFMDGVLTAGGGIQFGVLYGGDTSDDRVRIEGDPIHDPMTISAKIDSSDYSVAQTIVAKNGGAGDRGWRFGVTTSGYLFWSTSSDNTTTSTRNSTSLQMVVNKKYDVAVVYNGSDADFYVDGVLATDDGATVYPDTFSSATDPLIGAYTTGGTSFLGELDGHTYDLQIYWSALSAGNISTIHSTDTPLSTVKYWWPHAEGSGTTLFEIIEGLDGSMQGGATWSGSTTVTGLNGEGDLYTKDDLEVGGSMIKALPDTQTIAAGNTITADGCGGLKNISAATAVTTSTTNTFTAPGVANTGCLMIVCNVGAEDITLDNNALFKSAGGSDVVATPDDCLTVNSDGSVWRQTSALLAN
jgi:hypothetical protein